MGIKIAVVGLDGVSWDIVSGLVSEGYLTSTAEILDSSFKANLIATDPPWTPPFWTSIATGVNPGKHGIYSFYNVVKEVSGFRSEIVTGREACYPRLHEILALYKKKCLVANLPATYYVPSYVSNYCIVVSDWLSPSTSINVAGYEFLRYAFSKNIIARKYKNPKILASKMTERISLITRAVTRAVNSFKPSLLFVVFSELDWIMHQDIGFIKRVNVEQYGAIMDHIDEFITGLRKQGYLIVLVSDHGFSVYRKAFYPETALELNGIRSGDISYAWRRSRALHHITRLLNKHPRLKALAKSFLGAVRHANLLAKDKNDSSSTRVIPYSVIQALIPDPHYMFISPHLPIDHVMSILSQYNTLVEAYTNYEIYTGYCTSKAPDIVLRPRSNDILIARGKPGQEFVDGIEAADHHPLGIFSIEGFKDVNHEHVNTWDVAPILLSLLGLPVPRDTDSTLDLLDKYGVNYYIEDIRPKWLIKRRLPKAHIRRR